MKKLLAVLALSVLGLTACSGTDPHKGEHCTHSVTVEEQVPQYRQQCTTIEEEEEVGTTMEEIPEQSCISVLSYYLTLPVTTCDQWAPDNTATVVESGGD